MIRSSLRRSASWYALALFAVLAAMPLLARALAPPLPTTEVLEVNYLSIGAYQSTSASALQGVIPVSGQRAVGMDGTVRSAPGVAMAIGSNPQGSAWSGTKLLNGVDLRTGSFAPHDIDISNRSHPRSAFQAGSIDGGGLPLKWACTAWASNPNAERPC